MLFTLLAILGALIVGFIVFVLVIAPWWNRRQRTVEVDDLELSGEDTEKTIDRLVKRKKAKKEEKRLNLQYAEDSPFFFISDREVWVGIVPESTQDSFKTTGEKINAVNHLNELYGGILRFMEQYGDKNFKEVRCHEQVRFQPANVDRWVENYQRRVWNPSQLFTDLTTTGVAPHIAQSTPERRRMIMVRIGVIQGETTYNPLDAYVGDEAADEYFETSELEYYRTRANQFYDRLADLGAIPMDRSDLSWLVRKTLSGHFHPDPERGYSATRPWRKGWFDQWADMVARVLPDAVEILEPSDSSSTGVPRRSYVTTLTVADMDDSSMFSASAEWGKLLRTLPTPVEVSWRFSLMSSREWQKVAKKRIGNLRDERANRNQANGAPYEDAPTGDLKFDRTMDQAEQLYADLQLNPQPVMIGQLRLVIAASTLSALSDAVRDVKNALADVMVLDRKRGVQLALLEEQIPGAVNTSRIGKKFLSQHAGGIDVGERWTSLDALALPRLDSTPTVGDGEKFENGKILGWHGHVIGYAADNGAICHFDPHVQIDQHGGGGVAIVGASGAGKSSLSLMLFFWMSEAGVQTVVADPKGDFEAFCYYIAFGAQAVSPDFRAEASSPDIKLGGPNSQFTVVNREFWEQTDVIDLWRGRRGMLDPFLLCDNPRQGLSLARDVLQQLITEKDERKVIDRALRRIGEDHTRAVAEGSVFPLGLTRVAEYIGREVTEMQDKYLSEKAVSEMKAIEQMQVDEKVRDYQAIVDRLNTSAEEEYSRLLFGTGADHDVDDHQLRQLDKRRTVITMRNVSLPKKDNVEDWTPKERNAAVAMYAALHRINSILMAEDLVSRPNGPIGEPYRARPRALFVDEGYIMTRIPAGRDLLQVALRMGRSRNFAVVFISQQASDLADLQAVSGEADEEASTNQFPTVFAFWQSSETEALEALRLLRGNVEGDDSDEMRFLARRLTKEGGELGTGRCVMKDAMGRIGAVQTDLLFDELWSAVETNANARSDAQSRNISPNGKDWNPVTMTRDALRTGVVRGAVAEMRRVSESQFEMDDWERHVPVGS